MSKDFNAFFDKEWRLLTDKHGMFLDFKTVVRVSLRKAWNEQQKIVDTLDVENEMHKAASISYVKCLGECTKEESAKRIIADLQKRIADMTEEHAELLTISYMSGAEDTIGKCDSLAMKIGTLEQCNAIQEIHIKTLERENKCQQMQIDNG